MRRKLIGGATDPSTLPDKHSRVVLAPSNLDVRYCTECTLDKARFTRYRVTSLCCCTPVQWTNHSFQGTRKT